MRVISSRFMLFRCSSNGNLWHKRVRLLCAFFTILKFFFSKQSNSNKVKPLETVKKENWIHIWFNKVSHMEHVRMNFSCSTKVFLNEQESFFIYENLSRFVSEFLLSIELFLLKNFQFSFLMSLKLSLLQLKIFLVFLS